MKNRKQESKMGCKMESKKNRDELREAVIEPMLKALAERHDVMFKGWHEPVYGKKIHIGDTCPTCNTHFKGLIQDIENLAEYYIDSYIQSDRQAWLERILPEKKSTFAVLSPEWDRLDGFNQAIGQIKQNAKKDTGKL